MVTYIKMLLVVGHLEANSAGLRVQGPQAAITALMIIQTLVVKKMLSFLRYNLPFSFLPVFLMLRVSSGWKFFFAGHFEANSAGLRVEEPQVGQHCPDEYSEAGSQ